MLLWRLAPAELYNGMDTPPECPPGLQLTALDVRVLFLQRDVGGDVDGGIAGCAVMVFPTHKHYFPRMLQGERVLQITKAEKVCPAQFKKLALFLALLA